MTTPTHACIDALTTHLLHRDGSARAKAVEALDEFGRSLAKVPLRKPSEQIAALMLSRRLTLDSAISEYLDQQWEKWQQQDHAPPSEGSAGASDDGDVAPAQLSGGEAPARVVVGSRWRGRDGFERIVTGAGNGGVDYDRSDGGGLLTAHSDSEACFRSMNQWLRDPPPEQPKRRYTAPEQLPVGRKVRIVEFEEGSRHYHELGSVLDTCTAVCSSLCRNNHLRLTATGEVYIAFATDRRVSAIRTVELVEERPVGEPAQPPENADFWRAQYWKSNADRQRLESELSAERAANAELKEPDARRRNRLYERLSLSHDREVALRTELDQAKAATVAAEELLADWEMLGVKITGCTNHSGRIAIQDASAQLDTHISVMTGLVDTQRERAEAAEQRVKELEAAAASLHAQLDMWQSARDKLAARLTASERQREAMADRLEKLEAANKARLESIANGDQSYWLKELAEQRAAERDAIRSAVSAIKDAEYSFWHAPPELPVRMKIVGERLAALDATGVTNGG